MTGHNLGNVSENEMHTREFSLARLMNSLSFRLQLMTVVLSLVGVLFGVRDYSHVYEQFGESGSAMTYQDLLIQISIAFLFNVVCAFIIYRIVTKPVRSLGEVMRELAEGKLDFDVPYVDQKTEIGSMARKVAVFKQNAVDKKELEDQQKIQSVKSEEEKKRMREKLAADFESSVLSVVDIVASATGDMQATAKNLAEMAEKTSEQSATVATATEQTSANVQTVSAAVEELSASFNEINYKVTESTKISSEAVVEVKRADTTISTLSEAAVQIGDVVKLIQDIAGQTNLLALNATIEAARAGEAGKGFAVVASEVKNLANQTAAATEEIAKKIATVQNVSTESVSAIRDIGKTIARTSEIASGISDAVQQQTSAAREISKNVQQASVGTAKISESIMDVNKEAGESLSAANEVLSDSTRLFEQSVRLKEEIQSFLAKIRKGS
jgi:methyl-accepting chemotaxis protein